MFRRAVICRSLSLLASLGTAFSAPADALQAGPRVAQTPSDAPAAPALTPQPFAHGERIAFIGNALAEHFNTYGYVETLLHTRFPNLELKVRNFARPADEVGLRQRPTDYTRIDDPLSVFRPDTMICFFGGNESFAGPAGIASFKAAYEKFLDESAAQHPRGEAGMAPRFVLVSPIACEPTGDKFLPDGKTENENLRLYTTAMAEAAAKRGLPFVDLFAPTLADFAREAGAQFTTNGLHTNEAGDRRVAELLDRALFGPGHPAQIGTPALEKLRAAINDKSWIHQQDYRMLNGWYVYGSRNLWDRATFPAEFRKIRAMAEVRDRYVWDLARGKKVPAQPDDSGTGELAIPRTMFGTQPKKEPAELKYPTPEESIAKMKVPEGFEVQLVASEREFPELANVAQINFDNRGRLWAACMTNYPQWKPGDPKPNDKLLIFDRLDPRGRAGKCTIFYDQLTCPTGFEFWNGGVIVVDQPRLLFLKDTDGDDRADLVVELSDGWASDDTHQAVGAFEWSPGGLLHLLEGVSMSTTIETPWGPHRQSGKAGSYVFDPRTQKLRHFVIPGHENPWCLVFDGWGQGFVGDATTSQQHWETPFSGAPYAARRSLNTLFYRGGTRPNVGSEFIHTRQFPEEFQGRFVVACVINVNGLVTFTLRDDGAGYQGERKKKNVTTFRGVVRSLFGGKGDRAPDDLLTSENNMTFRPVDPQIGPDGALYFGDWCAALISHTYYSQRDPSHDRSHGRLYRLVYKNKPLLPPATQAGKPVIELLDQLKAYELRTRYRARRELRDRPANEVLAALREWLARLNAAAPEYDRLQLEALWVQQGHHAVETALLRKVLRGKTGEARAAATRVLADEWDYFPEAMELIQPQVLDEFPRTRVEAIRALSFVRTRQSVDTILRAAAQPRDYWIDYTLEMTLGTLEPFWKKAFEEKTIALDNPQGRALLTQVAQTFQAGGAAAAALRRYLTIPGLPAGERAELIQAMSKIKGVPENGSSVFRRLCIGCHRWNTEGGDAGPALDNVGARLPRVALLESILAPSAQIAPGFLVTQVETKDGATHTGFVAAETAQALTLRIGSGLQKIKTVEIQKREDLRQSSMPEGLAGAISPAEFLDLIEFLASLKPEP